MSTPKRNNRKNTPNSSQKSSSGKPTFLKKSTAKTKTIKEDNGTIRLNKYLSNSGICSRRDADLYIQSGNVRINGHAITEMGYKVKPGDIVTFDGNTVNPEKKEYLLLNKPKNFTTSTDEESSMRHVMELVKTATKVAIKPVGRMDKNTTGLLLFTNDTDVIRKFTQPNQKSHKIYQVTLDRNLKYEDLEKISNGITVDGHRVAVDEVSYIENEPKSEIGIKLRTSNVKVVRHIFESMGYDVVKMDRVVFAGLTKKNLPRGNWRFLTEQEIINLRML
jgi:23S rRNA pseudouridine2605 synthase